MDTYQTPSTWKKPGMLHWMLACLFALPCQLSAVERTTPIPQEKTSDIRILIDVSGSMKWNDPVNLRSPALRLVTELLPNDTRAGVWTFARFVNMLVPIDAVTPEWKGKARQAADEIHSKGLFTDIESALDKSTWDWKEPDPEFKRSIILLTDGLVDIDSDEKGNRNSRNDIITKILPRLQHAGATIHTIALSGEADEVLLQQLAAATNGAYEQAQTAENLERIFFRMFEKAANPDTLPLIDNTVTIDNSIKEATLLIFRKAGSPPSLVTMPDNSTFGENSAPDNVSWHHEDRYDLITITEPAPGQWSIDADTDPDNRVMVVTDLRMITTSLPNNIGTGDTYPLFVSLLQEGKVIANENFLRFVTINLTEKKNDNEVREHPVQDNGEDIDDKSGDGIYGIKVGDYLSPGQYELTVIVDGTTFQRQHHQTINVFDSPVMATIQPAMDKDAHGFVLHVVPRAGMVNPDTLQITATISDHEGNEQEFDVPGINANEWSLSLDGYPPENQHTAELTIEGERPSGKPLYKHSGPLKFGGDPMTNDDSDPLPETASMEQGASDDMVHPVEQPEEPISWLLVGALVMVFNIIAAVGVFFGYRRWRFIQQQPSLTPWDGLANG